MRRAGPASGLRGCGRRAGLPAVPPGRGRIPLAFLLAVIFDQGIVAESARAALHAAATAGDDASEDLAVQRIQVHEKNAWMLRSHLD